MNKQNLLRCFIVSAIISAITPFFSITVYSAKSYPVEEVESLAVALRENDQAEAAEWLETKEEQETKVASWLHVMRQPGFWRMWLRSFSLFFVAVLVGTVIVSMGMERNQPTT